RVTGRATPNQPGRESAAASGKTAGSPVHLFGSRGSRCDQQSGRAPVAAGGHRAQSLLRKQNHQGCAYLGNPHQSGRHLRPTGRILRSTRQSVRLVVNRTLNTYATIDPSSILYSLSSFVEINVKFEVRRQ